MVLLPDEALPLMAAFAPHFRRPTARRFTLLLVAAVDRWWAGKADRIEVFYLPKYAPERNPEEYLNCDLKANINTEGLPKDREELQGKLRRFMQRLARLPARIASYFEHKYIAYAAVPNPTLT